MSFSDALVAADLAARQILGDDHVISFNPSVGDSVTVAGVFDQAYVLVDQGGQPGVSTSGPAVFLTLADLPSDPAADTEATVSVDGTEYRAHTVKKDGVGGVVLMLHLVA